MTQLKLEIKKAIELEFCKALNLSKQEIVDAMNLGPCYLGSKKYFQVSAWQVMNALHPILDLLQQIESELPEKGALTQATLKDLRNMIEVLHEK